MVLICSSEQWLKTRVVCVSSHFLENFLWEMFCRGKKSCPPCRRVLANTLRCRKRAERDRKAAEKLLSCQVCKRKPSMAECPGERIATMFLTNMVRDVSAYQQKAHPGSRAWVDNLDGKGRLPAWVMFRSVYPGWWSGIKMEGCKHPLISCKAPTDITVMTTQRSGPKYGLFL